MTPKPQAPPPPPLPDCEELLRRALELADTRSDITYGMGKENWAPNGAADCSACLWRLLGRPKRDRNTDWIRRDAVGAQTMFRRIAEPKPGCVAVYGTLWQKLPDGTTRRRAGHVGVVVDVAGQIVVDCSSSKNGIRRHKQPVLLVGPSDKRQAGLIFCEPISGGA